MKSTDNINFQYRMKEVQPKKSVNTKQIQL